MLVHLEHLFFLGEPFPQKYDSMSSDLVNGFMQSFPSPTPLSLSPFPASPTHVSRLQYQQLQRPVMHRVGVALSKLPLMGHICASCPCLAAQILVNDLIHISDTQFSGELGCKSYSGKMLLFIFICLGACALIT